MMEFSKSSFLQAWFSLKLCEHLVPMLSCCVSIPYKSTFKFKLKKGIAENVVLCFLAFRKSPPVLVTKMLALVSIFTMFAYR